jgi:hypothetical protein
VRPLTHIADPNTAIAFPAFHSLVSPAVRAAACLPLRRARHAGAACSAPVGRGFCADCEATVDDRILASFTRLRGPLPTTRSGEPVRELALVRDHLRSPEAAYEDVDALARRLRGAAVEGEAAWLRAARAQLVHYPLAHLEERVRRDDAVRRGAAARPDRDLRQAAWAAPLRTDPAALDLLIFAVFRARRGVRGSEIPADLCERHGLSQDEARRRLGVALRRLRMVNPGFYAANLDDETLADLPWAVGYAYPLHTVPEREAAREQLRRLLAAPGHGRRYRDVVAAICAAADEADCADLVAAVMASLDLTASAARQAIQALAPLIAAAGLDWCEARCAGVSALAGGRVHRERVPGLGGCARGDRALASVSVRD